MPLMPGGLLIEQQGATGIMQIGGIDEGLPGQNDVTVYSRAPQHQFLECPADRRIVVDDVDKAPTGGRMRRSDTFSTPDAANVTTR